MTREEMVKEIDEGAYSYAELGEAFLEYMSDDDCEKLCEKAGFVTQFQEDEILNLKRIATEGLEK